MEKSKKYKKRKQCGINGVVKSGGTILLSWGKYGGFYFYSGYTKRLCLGYIAITYFPIEIDDIIADDN